MLTSTLAMRVTVSNVPNGLRVRRIASGLAAPIFVSGLPDGSGRIAVVERAGRIRIMDPVTGAFAATDFLNLTGQIDTTGEKGLVAIAFSPNFVIDRTFYLHLNPTSANTTEIRRYQTLSIAYDQAIAASSSLVISIPQPAASNHKGGFLAFDSAGQLLVGMGDGGSDPTTAQNRTSLLGKVLRLDITSDGFPSDSARNYAIPSLNPFGSGGGSPEILAMGLRNPFRGSVDAITGNIFIGDVGQNAIEEVDLLGPNVATLVNYGWNRREGSQPFNGGADDPGFTLPVTEYGRGSGPRVGASITGGAVYRGPVEDLQAQYVFGDFISNNLWSLPVASLNLGSVLPSSAFTVQNTNFTPDVGSIGSVVAFGTDVAGNMYIVDIGGEIFRIEPLP
ncbi:MAG: PQQ-dependent sugar dehydrogenase [Alphaproteobacteria bacterium]|nr:PQQ-dependent sugar dehydrogenase [Alphaproteobacteria bacterium]